MPMLVDSLWHILRASRIKNSILDTTMEYGSAKVQAPSLGKEDKFYTLEDEVAR